MFKPKMALAASLLLCWSVGPAVACINDRDTDRQERQFKALYPDADKEVSPSPEPVAESGRSPWVAYGAPILGVMLLGGAGYLGFTRRHR